MRAQSLGLLLGFHDQPGGAQQRIAEDHRDPGHDAVGVEPVEGAAGKLRPSTVTPCTKAPIITPCMKAAVSEPAWKA
jgi:hypothetical protein